LAGVWDGLRTVHNSEESQLPRFVLAPMLYLLCGAILAMGILASGLLFRHLGWQRPKWMAFQMALITFGTGLVVLYLAVWLPMPGIFALVAMVLVYGMLLYYNVQLKVRYVLVGVVGMIGLTQLVIHTVPAYRYAYFSGDVYLPQVKQTEIEQFNSPITRSVTPIRQLPGVQDQTTLTSMFGLLPSDGIIYTANQDLGGVKMFQARANSLRYDPSDCPNVLGWDEILPSDCHRIGKNSLGGPIYAYGPSLPSGKNIGFTTLGNTFIVVITSSMATDEQVRAYITTLQKVPALDVQQQISANKRMADKASAQLAGAAKAIEDREAIAYQSLPFKMLLPRDVPKDWKLSNESNTVYAESPDRASMASVSYTGPHKYKDWVTIHVAKKELFRLQDICGPTPGHSLDYLPCARVVGTDYYQATTVSPNNDTISEVRYQEVGDVMVISSIASRVDAPGEQLLMPRHLREVRDTLTHAYVPADNKMFQGADYFSYPRLTPRR
jgi:hypothetical protein